MREEEALLPCSAAAAAANYNNLPLQWNILTVTLLFCAELLHHAEAEEEVGGYHHIGRQAAARLRRQPPRC